jgi:hypothetical protein
MYQQFICFLAQGNARPILPESPGRSSLQQVLTSPELMLVLGLAAALTVTLFVWALVIRRRRPTDPHMRALEPGRATDSGASEKHGRHRRRRRRRHDSAREHRNPTLQETGGLPPLRPEDELPKG